MTELLEKQTILQPDDSICPVTEDWESETDLLERRRLWSFVMEETSALVIASPPRPRSLLDRRGRKLPPLPLDNSKALHCSYHGCACTDPSCPVRKCDTASRGFQTDDPIHICTCDCDIALCCVMLRDIQPQPLHTCGCGNPCCLLFQSMQPRRRPDEHIHEHDADCDCDMAN